MKVGSLFSGIGGLDLGLERAGMTVAWQSEIDPYACRVLAKHWPNVPNLGDITTIDWSNVEPVDVICGGYPCQPFSLAGVRLGESDPRHLWPYFAEALRVVRPRFALLENVPGHLSLGFGRVLGDLAELGFDAEWDCIPAAAVGAPHLRYRIFVVAHAHGYDVRQQSVGLGRGSGATVVADDGAPRDVAYADEIRRDRGTGAFGPSGWAEPTDSGQMGDTDIASTNAHPAPGGSRGAASQSSWWAAEPNVGRVAHGVPSRVDRLRALGNAVVPQVAEYVGRRLMEAAV
jgi:DNA (cytosine-5)-methyltransferase 1